MTVAELIEKLTKCDPLALVVTEDGETGYDIDFQVYDLDAAISRRVDGTPNHVGYVSRNTPSERVKRVVCVTSWGHDDDNAEVIR